MMTAVLRAKTSLAPTAGAATFLRVVPAALPIQLPAPAQSVIDLAANPPDLRLIDRLGASQCLTMGVAPWRQIGGTTLIATADLNSFARNRAALEASFGAVTAFVAPPAAITDAVFALRGADLALRSERTVDAAESCRGYRSARLHAPLALAGVLLCLLLLHAPVATLITATALALFAMASFVALKLAAWARMGRTAPHPVSVTPIQLPKVSVMVALYRESDIAARLIRRLGMLDYPRELLEILLVVEADDSVTREALAQAFLPPWMRLVVVPEGTVKTKPRALNYALDHCHGSIVGVYDAEDAPEPDQIRKVAAQFHNAPAEVACLQGRLDFYNPRVNWLSRCFTIEYAAWFRLFLPGIARLGLAVPLGGTTLFFRREMLEKLGRWDAHNVTEDADLGIRLARHGLRTALLDSTTYEEANCIGGSWIKQRSRWSKGYMMTWLAHMRDPAALWRQLGPRQFLGFQVLILGSLLQALLAPLLWSLWLVPLGVVHPLVTALGPFGFGVLWISLLLTEVLSISFNIAGLRRSGQKLSPLWVLTLAAYYPLATVAAYKAAWEMLTCPFYWDKTSHGQFDQ